MIQELQHFLIASLEKKLFNGFSMSDLMIVDSSDNKKITIYDLYLGFFSLLNIPTKLLNDKSYFSSIYSNFNSVILPKVLLLNELRKIRKFRMIKPNITTVNVIFMTFSNHFHENTIFRLQPILNSINKNRSELLKHDLIIAENPSEIHCSMKRSKSHFYSYVTDDILLKSKIKAKRFHKIYLNLKRSGQLDKALSEVCPDPRKYKFAYDFFFSYEVLYLSIIHYETCKRILIDRRVKVVCITGVSSMVERGLISAANFLDVKSIMINHALLESMDKSISKIFDKISYIIFMTKREKQLILRKRLLNQERVFIGRAIIFDDIVPFKRYPSPKNKSVLIATAPFVEEGFMKENKYLEMMRNIINTITKNTEIGVCIKLHPRDKYDKYKSIESDKVRILPCNVSRINFYKEIANNRIFLHFGSTAVYEAMLINRPTIMFHPGFDLGVYDTIDNLKKSSLLVYTTKELELAITECIKRESELKNNNDDYLKKYVGKVDGKGADYIIKFIQRIVKKQY